jgi:hypothetical protein
MTVRLRSAEACIEGGRAPAASVRVDMDDWTGHRCTDFFTLVKVDGRWQILSKVFYLHPE